MKKFLSELILPGFWLFFFVVSSKTNEADEIKNMNNLELRKGNISKNGYAVGNKETGLKKADTKAIYLTKF